jgi:ubiquinone/menaquinone biosynthesis C-methylase UbiE
MTKPRIPETDCTSSGRALAEEYDRMQAALREKGWMETGGLLAAGIVAGFVLEVGPGPGHLGLEWLLRTENSRLVGLDLNPDMVAIATSHARERGLVHRAEYLLGTAEAIPFGDNTFDALFSSHSLHEWLNPCGIFAEFWRVLRPGGRLYVSDLRRDLSRSARSFLERRMTSDVVREGLRASLDAAYTVEEVSSLLGTTGFAGCEVDEMPLGLRLRGTKLV